MTEKAAPDDNHRQPTMKDVVENSTSPQGVQPQNEIQSDERSEVSPEGATATASPIKETTDSKSQQEKAGIAVIVLMTFC